MIELNESEVTREWADKEKVAVSICCVCYNHEAYIADALDSFLSQKTNFRFEIIVRDDCSSDGTAEILERYKQKFPGIIKLKLEDSNQYSRGVKPFSVVTRLASGCFIALCDGDDYWLDENKLQSQFDYMQLHENVSILFENAQLLECDDAGKVVEQREFNEGLAGGPVEPKELIDSWIVTTATVFFRNRDLSDFFPQLDGLPYGDLPLYLHLAQFGEIHYREKVSAAYRVLTTGMIKSIVRRSDTAKTMLVFWDRLEDLFGHLGIARAVRKQRSQQYAWIIWLCMVERKFVQVPKYALRFVLSDPLQSFATTARAIKLAALSAFADRKIDPLK